MSPSKRYKHGLVLTLSANRPQCLAEDRLRLWKPPPPRQQPGLRVAPVSSEAEIVKVLNFLSCTWATSTKITYGAGLLVFHVYCDQREPPVPEALRGPASNSLLLEFLAGCAGLYAGSTLRNYFYGVKAWHTIHGLGWDVDETRLSAALVAADRLSPPSSKRSKRVPLMLVDITKIRQQLDLHLPLDAAVFACLTTTFWSASRLGEFTVGKLTGFDPATHVKRSDVRFNVHGGRLGLSVTSIHLPWTKVAKFEGEDVCWARQDGPADPAAALEHHFSLNNPAANGHLFSYRHVDGKQRPLTKTNFLKRLNAAAAAAGIDNIQGHSIRIGSVLEYMLRGVPFDVVRVIGRWSSDAYQLYLRKHSTILAPYIQNSPILEPFTRLTMPKLR